MPHALLATPEGLAWLTRLNGSPTLVAALHLVACSAGATALLGYFARTSCAVLCVSAASLISFTQRSGATQHDMHLLWALALLAASPCGDVWSLDAWGRARPRASIVYGVPLCLARALLGVVYLFPGIHKLASGGFSWAAAENISAIMYGKWFQEGRVPILRPDASPTLLTLGGIGTLAFELLFIVLALWPRTRLWALALGLCFHAATSLFLFIDFPSLWLCYVVLVPWSARRAEEAALAPIEPAEVERRHAWPSLVIGGALLVGATQAGVRGQTQAFPFACYPTFAGAHEATTLELLVELQLADGQRVVLERDMKQRRTREEWGQIYWLLGAHGAAPNDELLRRHATRLAEQRGQLSALREARHLRFFSGTYSTRPEDWGNGPLALTLLSDLGPAP
jgi:hypothetical protein